jgi:molecular chaperone GrpE
MAENQIEENQMEDTPKDGVAGAEATGTIESNEEVTVETLQAKLAEEQKKSSEYLESWKRSQADFVNLKRRTEIEKTNWSNEIRERILLRVLPVVDDFERALASMPETLKGEPWINGVNLIEKKLKTVLEQEGVSQIEAQGANFDPRFHDAVQQDDSGDGNQEYVAEVYQKGYKMGDRVIRPAAVKVGRR